MTINLKALRERLTPVTEEQAKMIIAAQTSANARRSPRPSENANVIASDEGHHGEGSGEDSLDGSADR